MYFVALFFSIFICSAIFYAFYPKKSIAKDEGSVHKTAAMAPGGSRMLLTVTK
jgi:hypothetical protein